MKAVRRSALKVRQVYTVIHAKRSRAGGAVRVDVFADRVDAELFEAKQRRAGAITCLALKSVR